jgi:hypothetical protein
MIIHIHFRKFICSFVGRIVIIIFLVDANFSRILNS